MSKSGELLKIENSVFGIRSENDFVTCALAIFRYQHEHNRVYRQWCDLLSVRPDKVIGLADVPFLPITAFRDAEVITGEKSGKAVVFRSSSTTAQTPSVHVVNDVKIYEESFLRTFRMFYGEQSDWCILALLPGYLERPDSSLVYMCDRLIKASGHAMGGFYIHELDKLKDKVEALKKSGQKTLLIGVSYALLDFGALGVTLNENFTVMETGGMKGRRKEMLKPELHAELSAAFGIHNIHSEYGMTEMLSQAYSRGDRLFDAPPWLRFMIRDVEDPLSGLADGRTGGVNIIDLANIHSCAFIGTQDLGRLYNGRLELMGRFDNSDIRGCNLMVG